MLAESSVSCNSSDRSASDIRTVEHEAGPLGSACVAQSGKLVVLSSWFWVSCGSSRMPLSWLEAVAWRGSAVQSGENFFCVAVDLTELSRNSVCRFRMLVSSVGRTAGVSLSWSRMPSSWREASACLSAAVLLLVTIAPVLFELRMADDSVANCAVTKFGCSRCRSLDPASGRMFKTPGKCIISD